MKQQELYSYVYDFISQLLENNESINLIRKIILYGSVARGNFTEKSDIDIFIDTTNPSKLKAQVEKELNKFEQKVEKTWALRGIKLPLKIMIENIEHSRWKNLREEIASYGKIIYGSIEETPMKLKHFLLVSYELKNLTQKEKMSLIRKLHGYISKKESVEYTKTGLVKEIAGEKMGSNIILIPRLEWDKIKKILSLYKTKYTIKDIWV